MSLAQEPGFTPKTPYRKKIAVDMPTRELEAAERYKKVLREQFQKANKKQKEDIYDLLSVAIYKIMQKIGKGKRNTTKVEQTNLIKIVKIYLELKQEFANEVL